jgi:plastocyanin
MKQLYKTTLLLLLSLAGGFSASATTWTVEVKNNVFQNNPAVVEVGDVILWVWVEGSHTTTSVSVPSGAASWNSPMNASSTAFDYTITTEGSYSYHCSFHPNMTATFQAVTTTSVSPTSFENVFEAAVNNNIVTVKYGVAANSRVTMALYDLTGKAVQRTNSVEVGTGVQTQDIPVSSLPPGMYFVVAQINNQRKTERIVIR